MLLYRWRVEMGVGVRLALPDLSARPQHSNGLFSMMERKWCGYFGAEDVLGTYFIDARRASLKTANYK